MDKRLSDFGIIIKYMPFLQDHGFTEFGKGQLIGKMEFDSSPYHDGNEQVVKEFTTPAIEVLPYLQNSNNKTRNFDDGEKNPTGSKAAQRIDVHDAIDQSRRKKYIAENNKWNFKNEDESSWITRIRKLADM